MKKIYFFKIKKEMQKILQPENMDFSFLIVKLRKQFQRRHTFHSAKEMVLMEKQQ